ncbi:MAG TPA: hypothetical protein VMR16_02515 [Candidatus Saccharimonadales bacterium]|nr:hypothetical protein [Candidatus Saccharimonadales bacterium]
MAKVIDSYIDSRQISRLNPVWQIVLIGAVLGILYSGLTAALLKFTGLVGVAGDIATILVGTVGIIIMLNLRMARPLLVAVASAISLWGLAKLTDGLGWLEVVAWSALLYALSYLLFAWLTRYKHVIPVLVAVIVIVVIVRITITL